MPVRFAVIVFPGSNCDHDAYHVAGHVLGQEARFVWHKETRLGDADVVVVPGGSPTATTSEAAPSPGSRRSCRTSSALRRGAGS